MSVASPVPTLREFLAETAAPRFAALVSEAERKAAAAVQEFEDLKGASGTTCWVIEGEPPVYFNVAGGAVAIGDAGAEPPFMTVQMNAADWARFASGSVQTGMLDDRSGQRRLGRSRIERLRPLKGTVEFVVTGLPDGPDWRCLVAFGGPPANPPSASVSIPADTMKEIQSGQLQAQMAFMQGKVRMLGDAGLVMQLGMAMFI